MDAEASHKFSTILDGQRRPSSMISRWAGLLLGFFLVWLFMFVVAPWIAGSPQVKPLAQFIEETGIDAGALYYTEIEETAEAEMYLHDAGRYSPNQNREKITNHSTRHFH